MRMIHAHEHAHPGCAQLYLQQPAPHMVSLAAAVKAKACAKSAAACKLERGVLQAASILEKCRAKSCYRCEKHSGVRAAQAPRMLPNMFNRGAMHAEEACNLALVYPVMAEQEELLSLFDRCRDVYSGK